LSGKTVTYLSPILIAESYGVVSFAMKMWS